MTPIAWILIILALSLVLFLVELVVLPGITVAGIAAFVGICAGVAWTFAEYGLGCGFLTLGGVLLVIGVLTALFFRRRTWQRVTLDTEIQSRVDTPISELVTIGQHGTTLTRLAPMGNVEIGGRVYEAKTIVGFIDPQTPITVTGFENQTIIVKQNQ